MSDDVASLLPPNASDLERAVDAASGARVQAVDFGPMATLWNPWACPVHLLPWLAWACSVDEWDDAWPEATRRRVIADSYAVHSRKGTVGAVKRALTSLGYDTALIEWFDDTPPGDPYTFRVEVDAMGAPIIDRTYDEVERMALATKNVRSHLVTVSAVFRADVGMRAGAACHGGDVVTVLPWTAPEVRVSSALRIGVLASAVETITVRAGGIPDTPSPSGPPAAGLVARWVADPATMTRSGSTVLTWTDTVGGVVLSATGAPSYGAGSGVLVNYNNFLEITAGSLPAFKSIAARIRMETTPDGGQGGQFLIFGDATAYSYSGDAFTAGASGRPINGSAAAAVREAHLYDGAGAVGRSAFHATRDSWWGRQDVLILASPVPLPAWTRIGRDRAIHEFHGHVAELLLYDADLHADAPLRGAVTAHLSGG